MDGSAGGVLIAIIFPSRQNTQCAPDEKKTDGTGRDLSREWQYFMTTPSFVESDCE